MFRSTSVVTGVESLAGSGGVVGSWRILPGSLAGNAPAGNRKREEAVGRLARYTGKLVRTPPAWKDTMAAMSIPSHHPAPPIAIEMNGPIWLKLRMPVPVHCPEDLLRWFTEPDRLAQWMGDDHAVELVPGGRYAIHWSAPNRTMEGAVIVARPTELVFSWAFVHEPETPARVVMVRAMTDDDGSGSAIVVIHGPYRGESEDAALSEREERAGHLEGWRAFLPVLHERLAAAVPV